MIEWRISPLLQNTRSSRTATAHVRSLALLFFFCVCVCARSGRAGEGVIGSGKWKRIKREEDVHGRDAASACPMPATVLLTRGVCSTSGRAVQRPGAAFCLPGGTQANAPSRYRAWTTTGNHGTDPRLLCMLIDLISAPPCTAPAPMHAHTLGRFIM